MKRLLFIVCAGLSLAPAYADQPLELEIAEKKFEERIEGIRASLDALIKNYAQRLKDLKETQIEAGALDKVLLIKLALAKIKNSEAPSADASNYAELETTRQLFYDARDKLLINEHAAIDQLIINYAKELLELQTELTKQSRLKEAITVRRKRQKFEHKKGTCYRKMGLNAALVLHYNFNKKPKGDLIHDLSPSGNDGVNKSCVWEKSDERRGGVMTFNGEAYINCGRPEDIELQKNFTVSVWVKARAFGEGQGIISQYQSKDGYTLRTGWGSARNKYNFGDYSQSAGVPNAIETDRWHHLITVFEPGKMQIFLDGALANSKDSDRGLAKASDNLNIGRCYSSRYFKGQMDDVRIYNRALSASEVKYLHAQEKTTAIEKSN